MYMWVQPGLIGIAEGGALCLTCWSGTSSDLPGRPVCFAVNGLCCRAAGRGGGAVAVCLRSRLHDCQSGQQDVLRPLLKIDVSTLIRGRRTIDNLARLPCSLQVCERACPSADPCMRHAKAAADDLPPAPLLPPLLPSHPWCPLVPSSFSVG